MYEIHEEIGNIPELMVKEVFGSTSRLIFTRTDEKTVVAIKWYVGGTQFGYFDEIADEDFYNYGSQSNFINLCIADALYVKVSYAEGLL